MSFVSSIVSVAFFDPNTPRAVLLKEIEYKNDKTGVSVVIPKDFVSDGVTIPKALWWYIPPWGTKASKAALVHDYLLELLAKGKPLPGPLKTRKDIDNELYEALVMLGIDKVTANTVWTAVRSFSITLELQDKFK